MADTTSVIPVSLRGFSSGEVRVDFANYTLTPAEARDFAATLMSEASYAERLPSIHEGHVNLLASCALCRAEAGVQTDRLTYDEDEA